LLAEMDTSFYSQPTVSMEPTHIELDSIPAVGVFINRKEDMKKLHGFFIENAHKLIVLGGLEGVGKTHLAAKFAAEDREKYKAVFWLTCKANQASLDVLLGKLHQFFEENKEPALRGLWNDSRPDQLERKVKTLIRALNSDSYLLIFDDFQNWISVAFETENTDISKTLQSMLCSEHKSKILLVSDKKVSLDPSVLPDLPLGCNTECNLLGLDKLSSIKLLEVAGLKVTDDNLLNDIVTYCGGNPHMMQIYSYLVNRYHDPKDLLASGEAEKKFPALIQAVTNDMSEESSRALTLLCTLRIPVSRNDVSSLGIRFGSAIGPLIDRFLVVEDSQTSKLIVPTVVRSFIRKKDLTNASRNKLQSQAADLYMKMRAGKTPESFEELQPGLEEAYHHFQAGDGDRGASVIVSIAPLLIDWGYVEVAEQSITEALSKTQDECLRANCLWLMGSIYDLRSDFPKAQNYFEDAYKLFKKNGDYAGLSKSLFRIGRINNALSKFEEADKYFELCIANCKKHGVSDGHAGSLLGMGWNRQVRSFPVIEILDLYEQSIKVAEQSNDFETLSCGLRQIGFLLWRKRKQKNYAKQHYQKALEFSQKHNLVKETGSVYCELGYLYEQWGDYEKAEVTSRQAIKVFKGIGNSYGLCNAYVNLGKTLEMKNQWENANFWYKQSRKLSASINNAGCEAYVYIQQGRLLAKQGKLAEAKAALLKAKRLCIDNKLMEELAVVEDRLKKLNRKQ
jgi:tetratricopeptide (TPR) repeat protein